MLHSDVSNSADSHSISKFSVILAIPKASKIDFDKSSRAGYGFEPSPHQAFTSPQYKSTIESKLHLKNKVIH